MCKKQIFLIHSKGSTAVPSVLRFIGELHNAFREVLCRCAGYLIRSFQKRREKLSVHSTTTYNSRQAYASLLNSWQFYGGRNRKISFFLLRLCAQKEHLAAM